jgi:hypothetical protein
MCLQINKITDGLSVDASGNSNGEIMSDHMDETISISGGGSSGGNNNNNAGIDYQNIENHLMSFHHDNNTQHQHHHHQHHHHHLQKFDLSNKHISTATTTSNEKAIAYNQQASRNISEASLPLDLCQVNTELVIILFNFISCY